MQLCSLQMSVLQQPRKMPEKYCKHSFYRVRGFFTIIYESIMLFYDYFFCSDFQNLTRTTGPKLWRITD